MEVPSGKEVSEVGPPAEWSQPAAVGTLGGGDQLDPQTRAASVDPPEDNLTPSKLSAPISLTLLQKRRVLMKYVDDVNVVLRSMSKTVRWVDNTLVWTQEAEDQDVLSGMSVEKLRML